MALKVKDARTVLGPEGAHPAIIYAHLVVDRVWRSVTGRHARVTGLAEEGHSHASLHYGVVGDSRCRAIDYDADAEALSEDERLRVNKELLRRLPDAEFDVIWESLGTPKAHLHVEWDAK